MMVNNDDREALPEVEYSAKDGQDALTVLMSFFEPRYRYWAKEPELSRLAVQQTIDYNLVRDPGPELARFDAGRQILINNLAAFFGAEQKRGEVVSTHPAKTIAWLFMGIYQAEVRQWLRPDKPNVGEGLKRLRELFALALTGVSNGTAEEHARPARRSKRGPSGKRSR